MGGGRGRLRRRLRRLRRLAGARRRHRRRRGGAPGPPPHRRLPAPPDRPARGPGSAARALSPTGSQSADGTWPCSTPPARARMLAPCISAWRITQTQTVVSAQDGTSTPRHSCALARRKRCLILPEPFRSHSAVGAVVSCAPAAAQPVPPALPGKLPNFKIEAVNFKCLDETGYDWLGSDEAFEVDGLDAVVRDLAGQARVRGHRHLRRGRPQPTKDGCPGREHKSQMSHDRSSLPPWASASSGAASRRNPGPKRQPSV